MVDPERFLEGLALVMGTPPGSATLTSFAELNRSFGHRWRVEQERCEERALRGLVVLVNEQDAAAGARGLSTSLAVDFDDRRPVDDPRTRTRYGLRERWCEGGPLDPKARGDAVLSFVRLPEARCEPDSSPCSPAEGVGLSTLLLPFTSEDEVAPPVDAVRQANVEPRRPTL